MAGSKTIFAARDLVLSGGEITPDLMQVVRPDVLKSWRRSLMSGANPAQSELTYHGDGHAHTALRRAAEPILSQLAGRLAGLEAGVLLADHDANIVRRWAPDRTIRQMLDHIRSDAGFQVREEFIGTNGVGSIIEHGGALQISGPEHLAESLTPFTCVGVPIHHPVTRRLAGIITLSCRAEATNPLLTPLMTSTAQDIEHRILEQASTSERVLLDEYVIAVGARRAPIAAVGEDLFIAGPRVTDAMEGIDRALLWEYVRAIAAGGRAQPAGAGFAPDRLPISRCRLVERDGKVIGALVELDLGRDEPKPHPRAAAPRPEHRMVVLPGKSAALAQTVSHATRLFADGVSVLIEGEPGVGKMALARALLDSAHFQVAQVAVVDASATGIDGAARFVGVLRRELDRRPRALLLRHLECLTPECAAASATVLEEAREQPWAPQIVATLTRSGENATAPAPLRRLIDTIAVGRVVLAPLRDRREDIAPTAVALLKRHRGAKSLMFSSAALRCLMRAPWPGNLRQLDALVRGLVATTLGAEIRPESLPVELQSHARKRDLSAIEALELGAILEALRRHDGNKVAAAAAIGISRSTLYRKLQSYHIDPDKQYF
jgi:sigma-54 dependent transcriptional regulator, acetoin dehydrogenase operon transcriptional activator AcoR